MAEPFVKWAGGKRKLIPEIEKRLPATFRRYWEPLLGGGALFFYLEQTGRLSNIEQPAILSDCNDDLIPTYWAVQNRVEALITALCELADEREEDPKAHYYEVRARRPHLVIDVAARFIYLNKTCFNGLYRVNKKGDFNVPVGRYSNPLICDEAGLRAASRALQGMSLVCASFTSLLHNAVLEPQPEDLVYFDPPYIPTSETANFTKYTAAGFGPAEQTRLRDEALALKRRDVHVLLSQADTTEARELYRDFTIDTVYAPRPINSKGAERRQVPELIIS